MAKRLALSGALCLSLVLGACGTTEKAQLGEPRIEVPSGSPPKRLVVKDLREGSGLMAAPADEVTVQFVGAEYKNGIERWRSRGRLESFNFQLGGHGVISSWEQGLQGMRGGGRRELIVPSRLSTGEDARIYVVDLIAVHRQTEPPIAVGASDGIQAPGKPAIPLPRRPAPRILAVKELRKGAGPPVEIPADVTVKALGIDYRTYSAFFNAWGPNRVSKLSLEDPHSVWATGLTGMRVGGRRELIVPAQLGYGGGPLIYAVELVSID